MIAMIAIILVFVILALVIFNFVLDVINDRQVEEQIRQLKSKIRDLEYQQISTATDVKELKEIKDEVLN